ncbi:MAG: ETC complex I subunit [Alphaproteobacteria bacterium]|nr:ETC complex I subunit [Alphaproteobacteria bacterium]
MKARLYRQSKTAMQSGPIVRTDWVVEFVPESIPDSDSLTGWTGSLDTTGWQRIFFTTREQAIDYMQQNNIDYTVDDQSTKAVKPKSYADNFHSNRRIPWTH